MVNIKAEYEKQYRYHSFERTDLFARIREVFPGDTVAYIGSSIHIAPSFVFPHVTYIDNSEFVKEFFNYREEILAYINSRKCTSQSMYFEYKHMDYKKDLRNLSYMYDIVISLFAPGSFMSSLALIKPRGILIYLPLPQEAEILLSDDRIKRIGHICMKGKKYLFESIQSPASIKRKKKKKEVFAEENEYMVYRKVQ